MNNDLISREALKKAFYNQECWNVVIEHIIDNAPTVEVGYLTNCANCERVEKIRAKRPQGEWKLDEYGLPYCDKCNIHPDYTSNFCPNCGADMRKEADNEID